METDLRETERAASHFAVRDRLVLSALVAVVTLWIRVVEVIPDGRRRQ
jgi:hypothetical protein